MKLFVEPLINITNFLPKSWLKSSLYFKISDVLEKVNQRNNEGINEVESNSSDKKRLSHEESELLLTYVKPNNNFEVQPKKRQSK